MKARIVDIKKFAIHDGDGIRTTVFFKGCPLKCVWCHNPESISFESQIAFYKDKCINCGMCAKACSTNVHAFTDKHIVNHNLCKGCGACAELCLTEAITFYGKEITIEELMPKLLEDKIYYNESQGGVTFSGGECLMQSDFCAEALALLKKENINTAVDTCGFVNKSALDKVIPYTDTFLYDVKAFDENIHIKCTGQSNKIILDNLMYLDSMGKQIEVRIPFVPNYNDNQIEKIGSLLSLLKNLTKIRVLPYHDYAGSKYEALGMVNTLPKDIPSSEEVLKARKYLSSLGLKVVE